MLWNHQDTFASVPPPSGLPVSSARTDRQAHPQVRMEPTDARVPFCPRSILTLFSMNRKPTRQRNGRV